MSKRGMLPRFRPATLGLIAASRPSIRPVKMAPPPPVPTPPRRRDSGFSTRAANDAIESLEIDALTADTEDQHNDATAIATDGYAEDIAYFDEERETPTAAGTTGPITVPRDDGPPPELNRRGRADVMKLEFDDETQSRPVDDYVLDSLRREAAARMPTPVVAVVPVSDLSVQYESLPSLEVRAAYDSFAYEDEQEPTTQAALGPPVKLQRDESSYERERAPETRQGGFEAFDVDEDLPTQYPSHDEPNVIAEDDEDDRWARGDDSGPRPRPHAYAAPVPSYDEDYAPPSLPWGDPPPPAKSAPIAKGSRGNYAPTGFSSMPPNGYGVEPIIPPAPRVPADLRSQPPAGFVVGVQPLRTPTPDAWGVPQVQQVPAQQAYVPLQQTLQPAQAARMMAQQPMMMAPQPTMMAQPMMMGQMPPHYAPQHAPAAYVHAPPSPSGHAVPPQPITTHRTRPVGGQLNPSTSIRAARTSRFSWFSMGAAAGALFTIVTLLALGVRFAGAAVEAPAPVRPPTQAPTQAQPQAPLPTTASAVAAPPSTNISAPAPPNVGVTQTTTSPSNLPNATRAPSPQPVRQAPRQPVRQAPPPRRPTSIPRASSGESEAPAAPSSGGGGDIGDLLGAGLKP